MHFHHRPHGSGSLAKDFGLIAEAIADTIRGLVIPSQMDSRTSKLCNCDGAQ